MDILNFISWIKAGNYRETLPTDVPNLLAVADYITKLHAICVVCGNIANISYRKNSEDSQILIGEKEVYEPRCRNCIKK